jgi:inner membrane protein
MDSITQFALGSSIALATIGRRSDKRSAAWKIALIGGMVGTLPDLDAFIDFGDSISNMIRHRAESHGLFYLTLASPIIGFLITRLQGDPKLLMRWCFAVWLILMTHVGIDLLTIYGTQIAQPWSDHPFGIGSLFVIDPAYTLPILIGIVGTLIIRSSARWKWNSVGLAISTAYILWSLIAHQHVSQIAREHPPIKDQPLQLLVTAAPLNTVLWRAVFIAPDAYYEGWYSLLDAEKRFSWRAYPRNDALIARHANHPDVAKVAGFSHGFFTVTENQGRLFVTDLRLGLEPFYSFRFDLGSLDETGPFRAQRVGVRPDLKAGLPWLWQRIQGDTAHFSDKLATPAPVRPAD